MAGLLYIDNDSLWVCLVFIIKKRIRVNLESDNAIKIKHELPYKFHENMQSDTFSKT